MDKTKQKKEQLDDAVENATKLAEVAQLQRELAEIKVEQEDLRNQLKRAVADYHNLEKRISEGRSELTAWGTTELLTKMLAVLDYLEQATSGVSETEKGSGWFKGVELAIKQFKEVLKSEGLDEIEVKEEALFDPSKHEAVDTGEGPLNMILKVVRKGYNLNGKIIRPTQVVVGKNADSGQARMTEENK